MRELTCKGERHQTRGADMLKNRSDIFQAIATVDATYAATDCPTRVQGDDETWEIRTASGHLVCTRQARLGWASDVEKAGVNIVAARTTR